MPFIDAHMHLWDLTRNHLPWLSDPDPVPGFRYGDYADLRRNYLLPDYLADAAGIEVTGAVFVETEWDPADPRGEVRWVRDLMARNTLPSVMVAGARLHDPQVAPLLQDYGADPVVVGIRHKPTAAPCPDSIVAGAAGSMTDPAWRRGFAALAAQGLSFDLQTPWWHLAEARALADDFGDTQIIVNHTGLPMDRSPAGLEGWRRAMHHLSGAPNVRVKISGLGVPGQPWTVDANRRLVLDTIEMFGVQRCMFGSNYPVDRLVAPYRTILQGFDTITSTLTQTERAALFHDTARRVYRLPAQI